MTEHIPLSISEGVLLDPQDKEKYVDPSILSEHGFTHIHFGRKWRAPEDVSTAEAQSLLHNLESANLKVLDVHGPHPHGFDLGIENAENRQLAFSRVQHRLKITHALGGDALVYHVPTREYDDAALARYIDGLERLEDEARNLGIVIALENHYKAEVDKKTLTLCFNKFDPEYIGFTFDTGHACMSGNTDWILDNCMDRLKVLHLNDNNGKKDLHWLPLCDEGAVNWDAVIQGIAKSPYDKPIQMEVSYIRQDTYKTREHFLMAAAKTGKILHERVYQLRQKTQL